MRSAVWLTIKESKSSFAIEHEQDQSARTGLGRLVTPEEVADAVLFLSSPRASYISGSILSIDGATTPMMV
ncbi:SDR family oxidoreductase [Cupriavidus necator]|uniref:SDR family oxidoreductase n=1 Tax=Cupriavidus necator TaxID=106590 RepID=UPI001D029AD4|nr:SDR family oxidoreductase [Cupriavidus necator]